LITFSGVAQGDAAAERMGDDAAGGQALLVDELGEVVDEGAHRIVAAGRPGAVAMAAQVRGDDVVVGAQLGGDPVPVAAVVAAAVHQDQRRRVRIAPVDVVQPQPLRDERLRDGAEELFGHGARLT
jgi:hypothetical protein